MRKKSQQPKPYMFDGVVEYFRELIAVSNEHGIYLSNFDSYMDEMVVVEFYSEEKSPHILFEDVVFHDKGINFSYSEKGFGTQYFRINKNGKLTGKRRHW